MVNTSVPFNAYNNTPNKTPNDIISSLLKTSYPLLSKIACTPVFNMAVNANTKIPSKNPVKIPFTDSFVIKEPPACITNAQIPAMELPIYFPHTFLLASTKL